jgi:hypothetical protein
VDVAPVYTLAPDVELPILVDDAAHRARVLLRQARIEGRLLHTAVH